MRIVIASENFPPDIGGPAIHSEKIAHHLHELKNDAQVITFGTPAHSYPFRVAHIPFTLPKPIRLMRYITTLFIMSINTNLIYAQGTGSSGIAARLVSLLTRTPYIIRSGGDLLWERWALNQTNFNLLPLSQFYAKKIYKNIRYLLIRQALKHAQCIIVPTPLLKEVYIRYYHIPSDKITVIPNPVPQYKKQKNSQVENTHRVAYIGRLVNYKNIATLIHAFSDALAWHPNWQLHIVGNGPEKETLEKITQSLHKEKNIIFHESLSHEKALSFIKQSDIIVSPSITDFNPNTILEALAFRKPVLASQENGLSVNLPNQFLINPFDRKDITDTIHNLIKNYAKAQSEIKKLDLSWSWDNVLFAHLSIIKKTTRE